jgi:hypothetical protein
MPRKEKKAAADGAERWSQQVVALLAMYFPALAQHERLMISDAFVAEATELPGLSSDDASAAEALVNLIVAIAADSTLPEDPYAEAVLLAEELDAAGFFRAHKSSEVTEVQAGSHCMALLAEDDEWHPGIVLEIIRRADGGEDEDAVTAVVQFSEYRLVRELSRSKVRTRGAGTWQRACPLDGMGVAGAVLMRTGVG